ncbi:hypothetical protein SPRG_01767 [Saprolegnia parasitica CBS 223.65]|uniref:Uncharacterized protein n=1 Tax=Saprolegnia parasitica (strain CBS 223.65) TaxID=695850 RepID=A0A067D4E0_SAPPC|nr:hypothetical protein SPRG_01767 [Saprolegnia parasitica CBS 223.65]KDO33887.1 hypothetical protein SPRG_01767 [Saprolegnia parasitica CBS 223.65]|eukprot:XP_012195523.1 hypothetical protein SPRG_01767 [Saprolegnia parasitica CBS 223.65]
MTSEADGVPWAPRAYAMAIDADRKVVLYVDGKSIELPVSDVVTAALVARHGTNTIPAKNIRTVFVGGLPRRLVKDRLVPEGPYTVQLSHLALDAIGSAQSLEPMDAPPRGFFGRLFVCLPSRYEGGGIAGLLAVYASTPVTVSPITRGVRAVLIFNLVYRDPLVHSRCGPPTEAEAVAAWIPASAFKFTASFYGSLLTQPSTSLAFDELCAADIRFVAAVAASKKFDIGLARYMPSGLVAYAPWPACRVPQGVVLGASRINISLLLGKRHSACFVMWEKRSRFDVIDFDGAVAALEAAENDTDADLWGYSSFEALVEGCLTWYSVQSCSSTVMQRLTALLSRLGSVHLVDVLLNRFRRPSPTSIAGIAPWMQQQLERYGWIKLLKALKILLDDALKTESLALLASLAGVSAAPMCQPLSAPFALECFRCLLATLCKSLARWHWTVSDRVEYLSWVMLLDAHVDQASNLDDGRWLSGRLPLSVIETIETFVGAPTTMDRETLLTQPTFEVVVPALERALRQVATIHRPMLHRRLLYWKRQLDEDNCSPSSDSDHELASATIAMLRWAQRMEPSRPWTEVLALCASRASVLAVPAFTELASTTTTSPQMLDAMADAVQVTFAEPWTKRITKQLDYRYEGDVKTAVVTDAFAFYARFAPHRMQAFAQTWLQHPSGMACSSIYHLLQASFWDNYDDTGGVLALLRRCAMDRAVKAIQNGRDAVEKEKEQENYARTGWHQNDDEEENDDDEYDDEVAREDTRPSVVLAFCVCGSNYLERSHRKRKSVCDLKTSRAKRSQNVAIE